MSILEKKKLEEANEHVRLAEKYLKVSPLKLKFSPEYDPAGDEFSRAATSFKVAKSYEESRQCLLRAVDCYKEVHSVFQAGKMLEQAVLVSRDMGQLEEVSKLAERGALMYRQVNKPEAASTLLDKAAKMVEKERPEDAVGLYEKAAETVGTEDRPNVAAEYMGKAGKLYIRIKDWDNAIGCLRSEVNWRREAGTQAGQAVMGLILVELKRGDRVAAEKVFRDWGGWLDGEQARAVTNMLQGYDEQDHDQVDSALTSTAIKNLDLDFAKLARDIPRPKKQEPGGEDEDEEDNELEGLC